MKNNLKYLALVLFLSQLYTLIHIVRSLQDNAWGRLAFTFFGGMIIVWFAALMAFTVFLWYKGNEKTRQKDLYKLIAVGVLTFFSVGLTFGWIS